MTIRWRDRGQTVRPIVYGTGAGWVSPEYVVRVDSRYPSTGYIASYGPLYARTTYIAPSITIDQSGLYIAAPQGKCVRGVMFSATSPTISAYFARLTVQFLDDTYAPDLEPANINWTWTAAITAGYLHGTALTQWWSGYSATSTATAPILPISKARYAYMTANRVTLAGAKFKGVILKFATNNGGATTYDAELTEISNIALACD